MPTPNEIVVYCDNHHDRVDCERWPVDLVMRDLPSRTLGGMKHLVGTQYLHPIAPGEASRSYDTGGELRGRVELNCPVCHKRAERRWEKLLPRLRAMLEQGLTEVPLRVLC